MKPDVSTMTNRELFMEYENSPKRYEVLAEMAKRINRKMITPDVVPIFKQYKLISRNGLRAVHPNRPTGADDGRAERKITMDWSYFDKPEFEMVNCKYLPEMGEGDTMATQIVTAVNKLVYKWYNDGDVYDNTRYLSGWANDLSSYANWLYKHVPSACALLESVWDCHTDDEYDDILVGLADLLLDDEDLEHAARRPKVDSIYDCDGPFEFNEMEDDEDW